MKYDKHRHEHVELNKTMQELMALYPDISDEKMAQRATELNGNQVSLLRIGWMRKRIKSGDIPRLPYITHNWIENPTSYRSRPFE